MSMSDKQVLGKGLSALIPNKAQGDNYWGPTVKTIPEGGDAVAEVPIDSVKANPWQPRTSFDTEKLKELSNSIREHGIIQPLIVTPEGENSYQLIAGERRLKAAKLIPLKKVPVIIRKAKNQEKLEISLIENLQRQNLNPVEEALGLRRLLDEFSLTQEEVATRVGKSRPTVANLMRILHLPKVILEAIESEQITFSHAKVILSYETEKEQFKAFEQIIKGKLTVAEAFHERGGKTKRPTKQPDPVLAAWEEKLSNKLGFKAHIKKMPHGGGSIEIQYSSDEDLKTLLDSLIDD